MPESRDVGPFELGNGTELNEEERAQRGGSVRRARQRASASLPPESIGGGNGSPIVISASENPPFLSPVELPPHSSQTPSIPLRSASRLPPPPQCTAGSNAIMPEQETQLLGNHFPQQASNNPAQETRVSRGLPPPRPPRPSYVPPLYPSDTASDRFRQLQQQFQGPPQPSQQRKPRGDGSRNSPIQDPSSNTPSGPSSPSAKIVELPVPLIAPLNISQPRRNASLGPPPSARKGASSYYPQSTFVAPILEEISEARSSYASSHVMPSSCGDGPTDHYKGDGVDGGGYEPNSKSASTTATVSGVGDDNESTRLVGQPSTGKGSRRKRMTNVGQVTNKDAQGAADMMYPPRNTSRVHPKILTAGARASTTTIEMEDTPDTANENSEGQTFLAPPSPNNSPMISPVSPSSDGPFLTPHSGSPSPGDPRVNQILGNLERGTAFNPSRTVSPLTSIDSVTSEKLPRRPPLLNINFAKGGETRASQTSLPELIRRATRLASNLDRARASRVGILDRLSTRTSRQNSISDILAAFPSPSLGTPRTLRWQSTGKTSLARDQAPQTPVKNNKEEGLDNQKVRECCGMPLWAFLLILGILVLFIAAAVVIPITLIVLPRLRNSPPSLASCEKTSPCLNGGTGVVVEKTCRCICANGFTGSICSTIADQSCTFADINVGEGGMAYQNATVGNGIVRLFSGAKSRFNIPLDSTTLLSLFSYQNLSCTAESVLITFEGKTERRSLPAQLVIPELDLKLSTQPFPPQSISPSYSIQTPPSQVVSPSSIQTPPSQTTLTPIDNQLLLPRAGPASSNGIIFAAPSDAVQSTPLATATAAATGANATPSSTSPSSSSSDMNINGVPTKVLDFARTVVLFIFQETTLSIAYMANSRLQSVLADSSNWNTTAVQAGDTISVDFQKFTINLGNGTVFGGAKD